MPMRKYVVVDSSKGLWAPMETLNAPDFESALQWCMKNGYDIVEEL